MPTYQAPRSDSARRALLNKILETDASARAASQPQLDTALVAEIAAFIPKFNPACDAIDAALSGRMKEVREREEARLKLDTYVRDFWEVLKRRAAREKEPAEILVLHGLSSDGLVPGINAFDTLLEFAAKIVKGDADAVASGAAPMSNPSAQEVAAELAEAKIQAADVPVADRAYDTAQATVAALRPEADRLIDDAIAGLRFVLRRLDPPSQRRVMRGYGFTFVSLPGEPIEDETPPATPAL